MRKTTMPANAKWDPLSALLAMGPIALMSTFASGYELATHGQLTSKAFHASVLGATTTTYRLLGIEGFVFAPSTERSPLGANYVDFGGDLPGDLRAIHNLDKPPVNGLDFSGHFEHRFSTR
jgi:hypothetical protein